MLNVGVIGYRNHAARMINIVEQSGRARIARVFHPERDLDLPNATRRIEDLLDLDAIFILSPNDTHYGYLSFLSERYGGYLFCEKPPVSMLSELDSLDLDHERVFFNFNYRFSRLKEMLETAMEDGSLGTPMHMHVSMTQGLAYKPGYAASWRASKDRHKHGIAETKAIHYVDLAGALFGEISTHTYMPANFAGNSETFDTCCISLQHERGVITTLLMSYAAPLTVQISVVGTNGVLDYQGSTIRLFSPRDTFDERGYFSDPPCVRSYEYDKTSKDMYVESLERALSYFLDHCIDGRAIPDWHYKNSLAVNRFILDLAH